MKRRPFAPPLVEVAYSTTPTYQFLGSHEERAYRLAHEPRTPASMCSACRVGLFITLFCYGVLLLLLLLLGERLAYACGDLPPPDPLPQVLKVAPTMEANDEQEVQAASTDDRACPASRGARLLCAIC